MKSRTVLAILSFTFVIAGLGSFSAFASSHREAPGITRLPQVDGTDFYLFRSYESGREGFVTLIANYNPLQDPYGGPNYFPLDADAVYEIHITNDGDAVEDITFRFRFFQSAKFITVPSGGQDIPIPLVNAGPIGAGDTDKLNVERSYDVQCIRGPVDDPQETSFVTQAGDGGAKFEMPMDNIGNKSIPDYDAYADQFVYDVTIPGCSTPGRLFAGQRKESFQVNLGEIFDLVNTDLLGPPDAEASVTAGKNITSIILEAPISCLTSGAGSIIGGWTTASLPRTRVLREGADATFYQPEENFGGFVQVSRLGNPLVNEVMIGMTKKNLFNASHPSDDIQFVTYVTNPTFPALLEILFGVTAPTAFPRADLIQVFLTGVLGLNQDGSTGEIVRLNTAIPPVPSFAQNNLGVVGGDLAGFPNGRRPGDDVVDIALRALMGVLLPEADAPDGQLPYTDGARQHADQFDDTFPYLKTPTPGSPALRVPAGSEPGPRLTLQHAIYLVREFAEFLCLKTGVGFTSSDCRSLMTTPR